MSTPLNCSREKLVLGTAGLAGLWGKVDERESVNTILYALEQGITHFDAAPAYADAERILARALGEWTGKQPFISTKAGKLKSDDPESIVYDFSPNGIRDSVHNSLSIFKREQLDLLFLHDPTGMLPDEIPYAIEAMQELKMRGLVNNIGIGGNYGEAFAAHVAGNGFTYFMGFNRFNIIRQSAKHEEYQLLAASNIQVWQASPLYMGLLGSKLNHYADIEPEWIPREDLHKAIALKKNCDQSGLDFTGLALQYVFNAPCIEKMVMGASNLQELVQSLRFLEDNTLRDAAVDMYASS